MARMNETPYPHICPPGSAMLLVEGITEENANIDYDFTTEEFE